MRFECIVSQDELINSFEQPEFLFDQSEPPFPGKSVFYLHSRIFPGFRRCLFEKGDTGLAGKIIVPENYQPEGKDDPADVDMDLFDQSRGAKIIPAQGYHQDPDYICTKRPDISNPYQ